MNRISQKTVLLLLIAVLTASCASRKEMLYLQDMELLHDYPVSQDYEARIQNDDKLNIVVTCRNPELALAFNLPGYGGYSVSEDGNITATSTPNSSNTRDMGYLVDKYGNIEFPSLGTLHVEGLTRNQLRNLIKDRLQEQQLLSDANVFVEFMNFKYTVLGEVGGPGIKTLVNGDRLTILEAIAQAGDLLPTARVDHVAVIRNVGEKRRKMYVDLHSKDLFLSPAYYVQQNDIVYVEPNRVRAQQQNRQNISLWTSGISVITSLISLYYIFFK